MYDLPIFWDSKAKHQEAIDDIHWRLQNVTMPESNRKAWQSLRREALVSLSRLEAGK